MIYKNTSRKFYTHKKKVLIKKLFIQQFFLNSVSLKKTFAKILINKLYTYKSFLTFLGI